MTTKFTIRSYRSEDLAAMSRLFFETVHEVNARDYAPAQLAVWAPSPEALIHHDASFSRNMTLLAFAGDELAGFVDFDPGTGLLDHLYVARDRQGCGIGTLLLEAMERAIPESAPGVLHTHASVTARPFFAARGWRVDLEETVERRGVLLRRFRMTKARSTAQND